ncbi:G-protein alpha subunit [Mycena chlorophos]|uniref:G-protein alpha subunit n=1 Tax=Mycena chlorophos TaxID=658473 RepID=A0A8H6TLS9_MYCCL|nr:G-protein alpha subunit [Mycena chlorophos]
MAAPQAPDPDHARSREIDRQLAQAFAAAQTECTILLAGTQGAGKSTIMKQACTMKIIHHGSFTDEELAEYQQDIRSNAIDAAREMLRALEHGGPAEDRRQKLIEVFAAETLSDAMAKAIHELWTDSDVVDWFLRHAPETILTDNASYFLEHILRIAAPGYVPTQDDVLRARVSNAQTTEMTFAMTRYTFKVVDIGGQPTESRKWLHYFERRYYHAHFLRSIGRLQEGQIAKTHLFLLVELAQDRLRESRASFESLINSRYFRRTTIVLFLNKFDLFRDHLNKAPMDQHFPDYTAGPDSVKAVKYILWRFMQLNHAKLAIYPQYVKPFSISFAHDRSITNAIEMDIGNNSVRSVLNTIKETILRGALRDSGVALL